MSEEKKDYLRKRRKSLILAIVVLFVFGGVLFGLSLFNKKMNAGVVSSGGFYDLAGKLKKSLNSKADKSRNILEKPISAKFSYDKTTGELTLKNKLIIGKITLDNAMFIVKEHGEMLYSVDFVSSDDNIFCRGVMKKGEDYFFIYFCSDNRN